MEANPGKSQTSSEESIARSPEDNATPQYIDGNPINMADQRREMASIEAQRAMLNESNMTNPQEEIEETVQSASRGVEENKKDLEAIFKTSCRPPEDEPTDVTAKNGMP